MEKQLIEEFKNVLIDKESTENTIQTFLENHTELIPLPVLEGHHLHLGSVISKFNIGGGNITDFAYLTKSSDLWRFVLIELESPHKKIFNLTKARVEFSAEFNHAVDQITSWKAYINDHRNDVLQKIDRIKRPLNNNVVFFEYVLVIGRHDEYKASEKETRMLAQKKEDADINIMTYDSLISRYTRFTGVDSEKVILSPWREQGYKIKKLPKGHIDTALFSVLSKDCLMVSKEQEKRLEEEGYMISEWNKGKPLAINNKKPDEEEYALEPLRRHIKK